MISQPPPQPKSPNITAALYPPDTKGSAAIDVDKPQVMKRRRNRLDKDDTLTVTSRGRFIEGANNR
jgi:hypothetical protein